MDRISLFEEYRLIERSETEVNGVWKGAHILLFFLAFVFGSFCTFCFHMLMYLFDEKCVLFPKLLSLTSMRHNVIYEFVPSDKDMSDNLPVDFLSTQWVDKSECYLPTYVPLVSGIFGLVWTTMFLMCSTGSRTLTGLQRPWRVLPPVFLFSLAMGSLCVYSSAVTHYGLQELCLKLGEITGSSTCTYTVNVVTLAYERRIRGVYQATRLTILSAWLHTACWLLSALLVVIRVLMVVDFQLVRIDVTLQGDIDKMLERHEQQIRTVSPDLWINDEGDYSESRNEFTGSNTKVHFENQRYDSYTASLAEDIAALSATRSDALYFAARPEGNSEMSLVPQERNRLARLTAYQSVPKDKQFIVKMLYDLVEIISLPESSSGSSNEYLANASTFIFEDNDSDLLTIPRHYGKEMISFRSSNSEGPVHSQETVNVLEAEEIATEVRRTLQGNVNKELVEFPLRTKLPKTAKRRPRLEFESSTNITSEIRNTVDNLNKKFDSTNRNITASEQPDDKAVKKSNLKHIGVQTETKVSERDGTQKVQIAESRTRRMHGVDISQSSTDTSEEADNETQTAPKEKQD